VDKLRDAVVARHLTTREASAALSEAELMEFLFLPGFTMKGTVTDVSGRGVGLDAVQDMVKQVRGTVRVTSQPGKGTQFLLQLPVTLSVVRTLLAEIAGEPYAFPLAYIVRAVKISKRTLRCSKAANISSWTGGRSAWSARASYWEWVRRPRWAPMCR
jgi:two-component system sensor histidine kinase and response regulator WspE